MTIVMQLLKNTQAWALALLLTFTATSKAELLFSSDGKAITIIGRNFVNGRLIIPNTIRGLPVTSIGANAFEVTGSGLTWVTIPNSVTSIGERAFYGCTGLTWVVIPNSVKSIGANAFSVCTGLKGVTIGNSVKSIGEGAFSYSYLTSVYFMGNAPTVGPNVFSAIGNNVTVYYIAGKTGWGASFAGRPTALWSIPR